MADRVQIPSQLLVLFVATFHCRSAECRVTASTPALRRILAYSVRLLRSTADAQQRETLCPDFQVRLLLSAHLPYSVIHGVVYAPIDHYRG